MFWIIINYLILFFFKTDDFKIENTESDTRYFSKTQMSSILSTISTVCWLCLRMQFNVKTM